ncbi:DNA alkylation repair protein [Arthrobacter sp. D1-17]
MSEAGEFIDVALQREGAWYRADELRLRHAGGQGTGDAAVAHSPNRHLQYYGSSVGAVRGTVRDALRRHPGLTHDEVTALSSELWDVPVFERRLAAVVLLQSKAGVLLNSDLTRIEGFVRTAQLRDLVDPLAVDVVGPLMEALDQQSRARADAVLDRWVREPDVWLRRAALLAPLQALRRGGGDRDRFSARARIALAEPASPEPEGSDGGAVREAVALVLDAMAKGRHG